MGGYCAVYSQAEGYGRSPGAWAFPSRSQHENRSRISAGARAEVVPVWRVT
jgi:hypothetical protein